MAQSDMFSAGVNNPHNLLFLDDDQTFREVLGKALAKRGYNVLPAATLAEARSLARLYKPTLALVDLKLGDASGLDLLPWLKQLDPDMVIVVLTGYASVATAVTAVRRGAVNYLCKPVTASDVVKALTMDEAAEQEPDGFSPMSVRRMEWEHIQKVLQENDGNISATARSLGMHRRTLQRKLWKKPLTK